MGKKLPTTPRSRVRASLRQTWLRSRERSAAVKRESNTCERCGAKGSQAKGREVKIQVHHRRGVDWDGLIDLVFERLLVDPAWLEVLCKDCHREHHAKEKK